MHHCGARSFLQFRLRTLLILVTIVALWLGWYAERARTQQRAVAAIEKLGGSVDYGLYFDPQVEDYRPRGNRLAPSWLRATLGADYFEPVTLVFLCNCGLRAADLIHLRRLTALRALWLGNFHAHRPMPANRITDAGLAHLQGMRHLEDLELAEQEITDAGLRHLRGIVHMRSLDLSSTKVGDAGLQHLRGMVHLKRLSLSGTNVTDSGLEHLYALHELETLYLSSTEATVDGLKRLRRLRKLKELSVPMHHLIDYQASKLRADVYRDLQQALPDVSINGISGVE